MQQFRPIRTAVATFAALWAVELGLILRVTAGQVLFTLDDPYIHLALAQRLASDWHYGLNPGQIAAPSSSILYPVLLALLAPLGQASALLINTVAGAGACALAWANLAAAEFRTSTWPPAAVAALTVTCVLACNLLGLVFSGMEHTLHLALCLACLLGAQLFLRTDRVPAWWLAAAIACPLIRYEGVTALLAVVALLAWRGRVRLALPLLAAGCAGPVAFGLFLHAHGLPPLPASVLVKAVATLVPQPGGSVVGQWLRSRYVQGSSLPLLALAALLAAAAVLAWRRRDRAALGTALFGLALAGPQLLGGRFDGFSRYEMYAVGTALIAGAAALAPAWPGIMRRPAWTGAAVTAAILIVGAPYVRRAYQLPQAASDIYRQQFQMHRFVTAFWRAPVAVNDIGLVSFGNPNTVLDLWGLASDEARRDRAAQAGPDWMDRLAQRDHVELAMIYQSWFPAVPASWRRIGELRLRHGYLVTGGWKVAFYATRADAVPRINAALAAFVPTLPPRSDFIRD